jgi:hypothetical protein
MLATQTLFCPQCGSPIPGTDTAFAPSAGPDWSYPDVSPLNEGTASDNVPLAVAILIGGILFGLFMFVAACGGIGGIRSNCSWLGWLFSGGYIFILIWFATGLIRKGATTRRKAKALNTHGVRCWGRIVSSEEVYPGGRSVKLPDIKFTVDVFTARPSSTTTRDPQIPKQMSFSQKISILQLALVQPGNYCAFRLDPSDLATALLDAFATPAGQIIPIDPLAYRFNVLA